MSSVKVFSKLHGEIQLNLVSKFGILKGFGHLLGHHYLI